MLNFVKNVTRSKFHSVKMLVICKVSAHLDLHNVFVTLAATQSCDNLLSGD